MIIDWSEKAYSPKEKRTKGWQSKSSKNAKQANKMSRAVSRNINSGYSKSIA